MRDFEYEPKVIVKRKGGFLGKFVAFVLGIIFGIVGGLGGVAYAGYFVVTKVKIDDAMNTVNSLAKLEIDYTKYISGDYGQKTVYDLVGDAYKAAMNIATNSGTLQDLDDISPLVYDIIAGKEGEEGFSIVKFLQAYDVALDADKMMDLIVVKPAPTEGQEPTLDPDTYLMDYLMDCVQKMPASKLFDMLHVSLNPMLDAIINGTNGDDPLSLGQLMGADLMTRVYELPVAMFLENLDKNDTLMMTIAYGPAYRYTVNGSNVDMNQVFYTYNVSEEILYDGDGNEVTDNIVLGSLQIDLSVPSATCQLTVGEEVWYLKADKNESTAEVVKFYAYTDNAHTTAIKYKETMVADLTSISDTLLANLTIGDVVEGTSGNKILEAIADTKIKDVPAKLGTLTIGDLIDVGDNKILAALAGSKLSELNDNLNKVAIAENLITPDTDNKVVMYLLYGKEGVHYEVDGAEIKPLQKRVRIDGADVYNEYDEQISGATVSGNTYTDNGVTYYLTDASATLGAGWYYVYNDSAHLEKAMYSPTTIADLKGTSEVLNNVMNRLTLSDVLSEEELANNKVLCHLSDVTISGLSNAIHDLTIEDVFEQDMYEKNADGSFKTDTSGNRIMKHTWEYMLLDPTTGNLHHEYTLEDNMNDLMGNFQKNVQHRSLKTLIDDGIIELEKSTDANFLNKNISTFNYNIGTTEEPIYAQKIGDLTVSQMIDFMSVLIETIP